MTIDPRCALAAAGLLAAACGMSTGPLPDGVVERRVRPSETSTAITSWDAEHYIWMTPATDGAPPPILVLFPGTDGAPANARLIGTLAASQGYRVIGLMYPNDLAVLAECTDPAHPECMSAMRAEIVEGVDRSPAVSVDRPNSIDGRLSALLTWLDDRYPAEGWDRYLSAGAPQWSLIALGGLSQGGGHAAYLAQLRSVPRVILFGAPADGFDGGAAPWVTPGATPVSRYYGLVHVRDPFASIVPNWTALGLDVFGPLVRVEESAPPFAGTHMLTTDLLPATGSYGAAHPSVFADRATPRAPDGSALLAPAWRYLLELPGGTGGPGADPPQPG